MIAEALATWEVIIKKYLDGWGWNAITDDDIGDILKERFNSGFNIRQLAIANFKEYAELNGITNYKFKEEWDGR